MNSIIESLLKDDKNLPLHLKEYRIKEIIQELTLCYVVPFVKSKFLDDTFTYIIFIRAYKGHIILQFSAVGHSVIRGLVTTG